MDTNKSQLFLLSTLPTYKMSTTGVSWDMHILYLFYTTWLHIWVKEYKSVHPLGVDPAHPTCTKVPWSAAGGAGPAVILQKLKKILQNTATDHSFPVHHQWCSQENSFFEKRLKIYESAWIFMEEEIKSSRSILEHWKSLYWERKFQEFTFYSELRLHLHEYVKWSNNFTRA